MALTRKESQDFWTTFESGDAGVHSIGYSSSSVTRWKLNIERLKVDKISSDNVCDWKIEEKYAGWAKSTSFLMPRPDADNGNDAWSHATPEMLLFVIASNVFR